MPTSTSKYSQHPGFKMEESSERNLLDKTGKSLEEWVALVKAKGLGNPKECAQWLKAEFKLGTNYANWIVQRSDGKSLKENYNPEAYVEAMFKGKELLSPAYEKLMELAFALGPDVKVCPCKTIVPFYRKHVFAEVKPSTKSRIDFGLALKDTKATSKLIETGGFAKKDRITHRIVISKIEDIDDELKRWLKAAYEIHA